MSDMSEAQAKEAIRLLVQISNISFLTGWLSVGLLCLVLWRVW